MSQNLHPLAGQKVPSAMIMNTRQVCDAYVDVRPELTDPEQRVSFGTSGHRGRAREGSFNEQHVLAISQAVCDYRVTSGIDGPLFLAMDTHALSGPAHDTALQVLAANGVTVMLAASGEFTPTPALSHAILGYNRERREHLADGIVITPSHNPPDEGGYKYNPTNGGPADSDVTDWIEARANQLLDDGLKGVRSIGLKEARQAATTRVYDYLNTYVDDLADMIAFDVIAAAGLRVAVDPLGGAGVNYWSAIEDRYRIGLKVLSDQVDPAFSFMSLDSDGKIRMDPSSAYAMKGLIDLKNQYDVAFACDTDHDRHGIVTGSGGLMDANQYLVALIHYLFTHRPEWATSVAIGKTLVSTAVIDKVAALVGRGVYEVPVGFKWFAEGLFNGQLGFAGEESAGASFLRKNGKVWTTDKDGLVPGLLAAEMTARIGRDPAQQYLDLLSSVGLDAPPVATRVSAPVDLIQRQRLKELSARQVTATDLAGESIDQILTHAPGNQAAIGGIKVTTRGGWFAARPSGTEAIYKIYAESFKDQRHLDQIVEQAQGLVASALASGE
ncbi:MAG: phosphoglucomutase (alpha-D-glucose-1,6-bisphosphate-dependent) [Proteobacteria bacterium]|nr:phosphoglucomutase (alpha-D-glucose-1,6-bisphosphate-dependent) [Pseudomonadota bacterium]